MASFEDYRYDEEWAILPKAQLVFESPSCCWVILEKKGSEAFVLEEGLPIFEEWPDAQNFIRRMRIEGHEPKLLYWEDVIKKAKGIAEEIIMELGNGAFVSFPPEL